MCLLLIQCCKGIAFFVSLCEFTCYRAYDVTEISINTNKILPKDGLEPIIFVKNQNAFQYQTTWAKTTPNLVS